MLPVPTEGNILLQVTEEILSKKPCDNFLHKSDGTISWLCRSLHKPNEPDQLASPGEIIFPQLTWFLAVHRM